MEKEPDRRYDSAAAMAEDLRRHLANEPVMAGPPSAMYRFGKWAKRHRTAFILGSAVAASLCLGLVITTLALVREKRALANEEMQRRHALTSLSLANEREREAQAARKAESTARQAAEDERNRAVQSRRVADSARASAEQIINDMLFDLRDQLEPIGRLSMLEPISRSAEHYFAALPTEAETDEQQRNRAVVLQSRGDILLAQGNTKAAQEALEKSLTALQFRALQRPEDEQRLHDLALGHERLGNAQETSGAPTTAKQNYLAALGIFERLRQRSNSALGSAWALDSALPHERLADLARTENDLPNALKQLQTGREILARLDQTSPLVQQRVAVLEEKLGAVQAAAGATASATQHYQTALDILSNLSASQPGNAALEAAQAIAHGRIATTASSPSVALQHAEAQAATFSRLSVLDPMNQIWQRQHATAQHQLGTALEEAKRPEAALVAFRRGLEVNLSLLHANPTDSTLRRDCAGAHVRLAVALFRAKEDARPSATAALKLLGDLPPTAELAEWKRTAETLAQ